MLSTQVCLAQLNFGLKGGLNFDSAGYIKLVSEQLQKEGRLDSKVGFHLGAYIEFDFMVFYLRPELKYIKATSVFDNNTINNAIMNFLYLLGLQL